MNKTVLRVFIIFIAFCNGIYSEYASEDYPWIPPKTWNSIRKFLLPEDHPAKIALDKLFAKKRPVTSLHSMEKAGFQFRLMKNKRKIVAKHPDLKGYLIKTYLDFHHIATPDWKLWQHRARGAKLVSASISRHHYDHLMKAPCKWIYLIPMPPPENGRTTLLVVEDMQPLTSKKNKRKYYHITSEQLEALYIILKENLLHDSIYIHNIPFSKDGKIAFLDLEHYHSTSRPVRYEKLTPYFSPHMQFYWNALFKNS